MKQCFTFLPNLLFYIFLFILPQTGRDSHVMKFMLLLVSCNFHIKTYTQTPINFSSTCDWPKSRRKFCEIVLYSISIWKELVKLEWWKKLWRLMDKGDGEYWGEYGTLYKYFHAKILNQPALPNTDFYRVLTCGEECRIVWVWKKWVGVWFTYTDNLYLSPLCLF